MTTTTKTHDHHSRCSEQRCGNEDSRRGSEEISGRSKETSSSGKKRSVCTRSHAMQEADEHEGGAVDVERSGATVGAQ